MDSGFEKHEQQLDLTRLEVEAARSREQAAWAKHVHTIKQAHDAGMSYQTIANRIGITKARVFQIVTGKK